MKRVGEGSWVQTRVEELRKIRSTDTYIHFPSGVARFVSRNISPSGTEVVPLV